MVSVVTLAALPSPRMASLSLLAWCTPSRRVALSKEKLNLKGNSGLLALRPNLIDTLNKSMSKPKDFLLVVKIQ